jgi:hypothetical protein
MNYTQKFIKRLMSSLVWVKFYGTEDITSCDELFTYKISKTNDGYFKSTITMRSLNKLAVSDEIVGTFRDVALYNAIEQCREFRLARVMSFFDENAIASLCDTLDVHDVDLV